ncbi:hypothetical protein BJ165DRAFT_1530910 [Panaeolus papilionaceus]|nr:hypothetical protein BJ165DRAFT_1530910 [Panaeolus papilionaceus]
MTQRSRRERESQTRSRRTLTTHLLWVQNLFPGLSGVSRRLLNIWRAIEQVRVNKDNALRLVGRCTDIFECIKADISRNGDRVPKALELPIRRLEDTLDIILQCMTKHIRQVLILQYLRRNSISRDILYCGSLLDDALMLINYMDSDQDSDTGSPSTISLNVHERAQSTRESTRQRVANAVASCVNHTSALAPELLSIGVEVANSGVIPGLSGVARCLWKIWRAIEQVRVNKVNALRLIRRCVDILECIKAEINRNGATVPTALAIPILRLEDTLDIIHRCMQKHSRRALILQYLRKNSISEDISYCNNLLDDALTLINVGVAINPSATTGL